MPSSTFFATLANADDWVEMEVFGKKHEKILRNYPELPNGIPSHDTIQRVFAMAPSRITWLKKELLDYAGTVTDLRQEKKVLHKMMDITFVRLS